MGTGVGALLGIVVGTVVGVVDASVALQSRTKMLEFSPFILQLLIVKLVFPSGSVSLAKQNPPQAASEHSGKLFISGQLGATAK